MMLFLQRTIVGAMSEMRRERTMKGVPRALSRVYRMGLCVLSLLAGCWSVYGGPPALASLPSFHTPSGNIGCYADGGRLRCDIGQKSWRGPARPATCPLAYGDSFTLSANGRPIWTCHGDTALRSEKVLPYGATWRSGPFTCTS